MQKLRPIVRRLPAYCKLAWALARERAIPFRHRAPLYSIPVYYFSPLHIPVSAVPILGQVDGPLLILLAIRHARAHCPETVLGGHLERLHLSRTQLDDDVAAIQSMGKRATKKAVGATGRGLRFARRVAGGFSRRVARRLAEGEG